MNVHAKKHYTYGVDASVLPHRDDCIIPIRKGNPQYPLPPLFADLSPKEQAWWRINGCCIQETPVHFAEAYAFFLSSYLWPRDASFFEDRRAVPPFHYLMIHDIAAYHYNAFGAPRYACKTTLIKALTLLLLLTRRNYRIGYLTSKQKMYRRCVNDVRKQITNNPHIYADFGNLKPSRGGESWNSDEMELAAPFSNSFTGMSLDSRERGWHGETLFIDDPEKDPDTDEVIPEYVRKLDEKLRFVFMPMVEVMPDDLHRREISRVGRCIAYFGTVIGENMVLNRILTAEPGGPFDAWNRWKFEQEVFGRYLWPERWGKRSSEITRLVLGSDAFDSEKQNRPGKSQLGKFEIDPLYHTYSLEDTDDFLSHPWESNSLLRWAVQSPEGPAWKSLRAQEFLTSMNIGIVIDTAHTEKVTQHSDFTVIHVFGNDINFCLWSLDIRRGRWDTDTVIKNLIELCFLWRPTFVAVEACGLYGRIADEILLNMREQLLSTMGWVPVPKQLGPFNTKYEGKGARIDRISGRFSCFRIRFPYWRRASDPYDQCWHEVQNFTKDLSKLKYDDIIDTIGLTPYVFRGPGGRPVQTNPWDGKTIEQLILSGRLVTEHGAHLLDMLPSLGDLGEEAMGIAEAYYRGYQDQGPKAKDAIRTVISRPIRTVTL